MSKAMKDKITFRIPSVYREKLNKLAERKNEKVAKIVRDMVMDKINEYRI